MNDKLFVRKQNIGNEYFEGDINDMIKCATNIIKYIDDDFSVIKDKYKNHLNFKLNDNDTIDKKDHDFIFDMINKDDTMENSEETSDNDILEMSDVSESSESLESNDIECENFTCTKCGKKFQRKESFVYHVEHDACKEKDFCCNLCGKYLSSQSSLYRH